MGIALMIVSLSLGDGATAGQTWNRAEDVLRDMLDGVIAASE
jgi:hypothetical protein